MSEGNLDNQHSEIVVTNGDNNIVVRYAREDDEINHIVDHTGTGSGVATGDDYLLQEFKRNVRHEDFTVI